MLVSTDAVLELRSYPGGRLLGMECAARAACMF